ncbi:MAG TPA: UDP-N-acetylmuramoyl-tripeptide--D-alanyl-D-alanine ligase, partial [Planctomycetota bacterium]|nr:UDP-N-acetylmuramoyl-tripeptide--D-alanyl-D-alanine ligase [Planctomycetota bacterium]
KTTTKEMIAHVLSPQGKLVWAKRSFNNFIGLPLTLFEVVPDAFAVVLEMGTSAPGEIRRLCDIARPTIGVITNISTTHLKGLKSIEGVAAAKAELLEALGTGGVAILNADDEWSRKIRHLAKGKLVTFGAADDADIIARDVHVDTEGLSFVTNEHVRVELSVPGRHNVSNALAAIAVCRRLGLDMKTVAARLASFAGVPMRMELVQVGAVTVLNDAYNANPGSMSAALDAFRRHRTSCTRHFVCGDMLELGPDSPRCHRELGAVIAASDVDRLWLLGTEVQATREGALEAGMPTDAIVLSDDYDRLETKLLDALADGDVVLLKGSRGMRVERVMDGLRAREESRRK